MRRAAKVDRNHQEIVQALRGVGASVLSLAAMGQGCPDALVGFRGANVLLEIKNPHGSPSHRALTKMEQEFHRTWQGRVVIVETVDDALRTIGAIE